MAYTELTVQSPGRGAELDMTAVPSLLGNCFDNDGKTVIIVDNGWGAAAGGTDIRLIIHTTQEGPGGEPLADLTHIVPTGELHHIGPFAKDVYNHGSRMNELVNCSCDTGAGAENLTFTFGGNTTAVLPWDGDTEDFVVEFEGLAGVGAGNIRLLNRCQHADGVAFVWEWCGDNGHQDMGAITMTPVGPLVAMGASPVTVAGGASTHQGQVLIDYEEATASGPIVTAAFIAVVSAA